MSSSLGLQIFRLWLGAWRWLENVSLEADPDSSWASRSRGPPYFLPQGCFLLWFIYTRACKLNTVKISAWNMSGGGWKTRRKDWAWEQAFPTQNTLNPFFFFLKIFWCEPFLKPSLNLLQYYFCGIPAPPPGIEPILPALEGGVLTTGSSGQSPSWIFIFLIFLFFFPSWIFKCKLTSKIPSVLPWAYIQRETGSERIQAPQRPLQHCLQ